jgi:hypothetical protein
LVIKKDMGGRHWTIPDLIDLEFLMEQDKDGDPDELAARDRDLYAELTADRPGTTLSPRELLQGWLEARRQAVVEESGEDHVLPGRMWHELFVLFFWAVLFGGLLTGGGFAFSFLAYSGSRPVNVTAYFGLFVLLEGLFFTVFFLPAAARRLMGKGGEGFLLYRICRRLFEAALDRLARKAVARTSADTRLQWTARSAMMHRLRRRYGAVFNRPFFLLAQLLGVGFNAGILGATLLKVIGSDVAFGWQTTLQIGTETVYTLVRWISLPWSWLGRGTCCPTPDQIEGSKLVLKDGIYHLATPDLVSWWPFLCLAVLFYGLLPRIGLLLFTLVQQKRELSGLTFDHGGFRQLLHRMQTPLLSTRAGREPVEAVEDVSVEQKIVEARSVPDIEPEKEQHAAVPALIPDEIFGTVDRRKLENAVRKKLGYEVVDFVPVLTLDRTEEEECELVARTLRQSKAEDIFFLLEAWQPPIRELFSFLAALRRTLGEQPVFILALIGKPVGENLLTPVDPLHLRTWQKKTAVQGDPGLQLVDLVGTHDPGNPKQRNVKADVDAG